MFSGVGVCFVNYLDQFTFIGGYRHDNQSEAVSEEYLRFDKELLCRWREANKERLDW